MESVKQAANYVSETVQGAVSGASHETNKEVAKDGNASAGTRYVDSCWIEIRNEYPSSGRMLTHLTL